MSQAPKLLDRVRDAIRTRHYSPRTEEVYVYWIRRYIVFAVLFLHRDVLQIKVGAIAQMPRARTPTRLPVVLIREEVRRVLQRLTGTMGIVGTLLYGAGLRLQEELRVKDVDFDLNQLLVRR